MKKLLSIFTIGFLAFAFTNAPSGYTIGDIATDFKLKNVDGKNVSLSNYKDAKGFIVIFTCNHCPYAVKYEERIVALHKKYEQLGYPVVAINPNDPGQEPDDSFDAMKVRAKEKGFTFAYLFDDGQKIYPQYGAKKTPHVFLLNKKREVKYIGAIDDNVSNPEQVKVKYLEDAIADLEAGREVKTAVTKAVGCGIKSK
jgi:peroxiredoxin